MQKTPAQILKEYWGFDHFKPAQEAVIKDVMEGSDVLALMPTGGGKSLCYQVPGMAMEGICVVISPLVALINDQVNRLKSQGIKAIGLTAGIERDRIIALLDNCQFGGVKFLYLSPERLQQEIVRERLVHMNINLIAIDEAHCISSWGHDFRPSYLDCNILRSFTNAPLIALTATATKKVQLDIVSALELKTPKIHKASFKRTNISYEVFQIEDKNYYLLLLCKKAPASVIVYVNSRRTAQTLSEFLNSKKVSTNYFHGGCSKTHKEQSLKEWLTNKKKVMVATNAFGMGIDKANVSAVIHFQVPDSIENYYQESGRAGRNGEKAFSYILLGPQDKDQALKQFIGNLAALADVQHVYAKLNSYLRVPYGEGMNQVYTLSFNAFVLQYQLGAIKTFNALKILDQYRLINIQDDFEKRTSIKFICHKQELYKYMDIHKEMNGIIAALTRTYGGLFEFETKINTFLIAKKLEVSVNKINSLLQRLHTDKIIQLEAQSSDLKIHYLVPREDHRSITPHAKSIEALKQEKEKKMMAMIAYVSNNKQCRNIQLLSYFDEVTAPCNSCDVCMQNSLISTQAIESTAIKILGILEHHTKDSREITELLSVNKNLALNAIQHLLMKGKITINDHNEYARK